MPGVYKMIDVVGTSEESFAAATKIAVEEASQTVHHVNWFEVVEMRGAADGTGQPRAHRDESRPRLRVVHPHRRGPHTRADGGRRRNLHGERRARRLRPRRIDRDATRLARQCRQLTLDR